MVQHTSAVPGGTQLFHFRVHLNRFTVSPASAQLLALANLEEMAQSASLAAEARAVLGVLPDFVWVHRHALRHVKR